MMSGLCSPFAGARVLFAFPPSFRVSLHQQHCWAACRTLRATRFASSNTPAAGRSTHIGRMSKTTPNGTPHKSPAQSKAGYKPVDNPTRTGYANYIDAVVGRGAGRQEPVLLYKAPSHTNYYIACGFMSACFALAAGGAINSVHATYWNRQVLWWQLPTLSVATGVCVYLTMRTSTATRRLIHELWLLPRASGGAVTGPRMVEVRCRAWPLPMLKDKSWTAPLEDMTLSRRYGSTFYGTERERGGRHSIAADVASDAAEYKMLEEHERKRNGVIIGSLLSMVERAKKIGFECRQVLQWYGLNAWLVVKDKGTFKLDGRGLMLQGGKGEFAAFDTESDDAECQFRTGRLIQTVQRLSE